MYAKQQVCSHPCGFASTSHNMLSSQDIMQAAGHLPEDCSLNWSDSIIYVTEHVHCQGTLPPRT